MKKFLVLLLAALMVFSFAACGGGGGDEGAADDGAMKVAMVTDYGDITDQSFNQTTYEACKAFCESNGIDFTYKKPASDADADRESSMEEAIEEGYNVIVMPGYAFATSKDQTYTALYIRKSMPATWLATLQSRWASQSSDSSAEWLYLLYRDTDMDSFRAQMLLLPSSDSPT